MKMFRKPLIATALMAGLFANAAGAASASGLSGLDFRLDNYRYSTTIESLHMSVAGDDSYTTLHIGGPVDPRSYHTVRFDGDVSECNYDLYATLSDGETVTWSNVDLCHTTDLSVH